MLKKISTKNIFLCLLIIEILCGVFRIFTFSTGSHGYDGADFLEDIYWAQATLNSGKLLASNFNYPYPIPFGANIVMLPFVYFLGPSLLANQLGMLTYFVFYLFGINYLGNSIFKGNEKKYVFILISTLFIFTYMGDNILHHILYYGIAFVCFIFELGTLIRILDNDENKLNYFIIMIFCFVGSANGISTVVLSNLAIIVALAIYILVFRLDNKKFKSIFKRNNILPLLIIILVTCFGLIAYKIAVANSGSLNLESGRLMFGDADKVTNNLIYRTISDYLFIFDIKNTNANIIGIIMYGGKLLFAILIAVISVIALKHVIKEYMNINKCYTFTYIACFVLMLISFSFHTLNINPSDRYLFQMVFAMFIVVALFITTNIEKMNLYRNLLIVVLTGFMLFFQVELVKKYIDGRNLVDKYKNIIEILNENNSSYGFSSVGDGVALLSISNGKINTAFISNSKLLYYNCFDDAYDKPNNTKNFFVLLEKQDFKDEYNKNLISCIEYKEYSILIYGIEFWEDFIKMNGVETYE